MTVKKCDLCGAECPDVTKVREVQIRKRSSLYDTRLKLEKTFDVCIDCIETIFVMNIAKPVPDRNPMNGTEGEKNG